jgi:uncharacterized protein YjiS (DUF1127 family)
MQNDTTLSAGPGRAAASVRRPRLGRWRAALATIGASLRTWRQRSRSRRALQSLTDHDLRDIGLTPTHAWREAQKPFWVP